MRTTGDDAVLDVTYAMTDDAPLPPPPSGPTKAQIAGLLALFTLPALVVGTVLTVLIIRQAEADLKEQRGQEVEEAFGDEEDALRVPRRG